ncbi:MAG TPA: class I SAM-dependent methyltransferase [Candidatus Kryptonia bacterium]|nr:class I SAM-dependent methyltransferase [Candidatus Kryptonia bacterium]
MSPLMEEIAEQRRLLDRKVLRYSFDFSQYYHRWFNRQLLALLDPSPDLRVLDCGCGTGVLLPALARRRQRSIGLDLSLDNLAVARAASRALVVGDVNALPLAHQCFDHIICRGVLHHVPDIERGFRQLFAIAKDGGDLVVAEPVRNTPVHGLRVMAKLCSATTLTSAQWIEAAQAAGFQMVRWFPIGYLAFPLLGYPEMSYVFRYAPFRMPLARFLLRVDRLIERLPFVRAWSWQAVFHFKKPDHGAGRGLVDQ